jgi:polyisoprenoid-binding protein YceI
MKRFRPLVLALLLPLSAFAAERFLKLDPASSYVEVDVGVTIGSFTARLDNYELRATADDKKSVKTTLLTFKFSDLKTGKPDRDAKMIEWLGGGEPTGKFEAGIIALTPDGQGRVTGYLTMHGEKALVEFPVQVTKADGVITITGEATVDCRNWKLKVIRMALVEKVDPEVKVRFKFSGTVGDVVPPPTPPAK